MEHFAHAAFLVATQDVCDNGGTEFVQGFSTIINVAKYLLSVSIFLGAAIWLATEFFRESQTGSFKVSSFIFAHQLPLLLLLIGVGLLTGLTVTQFGVPGENAVCKAA